MAACQDGEAPFTCSGGERCTCEWLKENLYCNNPDVGATVRESCPLTCGVCSTTTSTLAPVTSTASTTAPPTTPSTTPPTTTKAGGGGSSCQDGEPPFSGCAGGPCTCEWLKENLYCNNADYGAKVRESCPLTCAVCTGTTSTQAPITSTASTTDLPTTTSTTAPSTTAPSTTASSTTPSTTTKTSMAPDPPCQDTVGPPGWTCGSRNCTCPEVQFYCSSNTEYYSSQVLKYCPLTCKVCRGPTVPTTTSTDRPWWWR